MISIRPTRAGDLPALAALFTARFGHAAAAAEWDWKYRPWGGQARSLVAVDGGGSVVAHAGALRLPARWCDPAAGQPREGGIWQLTDFAGEAGAAGLRPPLIEVGRRLLADLPAAGDAPWIFGFPSERHFRLGARVFGYRPLGWIEPLSGLLPGAFSGNPPRPAGTVTTGDLAASWAEEAWEACGVLGVRRTVEFLNWRYHTRPCRYYRFYRLPPCGRAPAPGLAVFAFAGEEALAAELWLPAPGDLEWYPSMLAVAADLRQAGLQRWRFWPRRTFAGADPLLDALGLRPTGDRVFLGCRGAAGTDPAAAAAGFTYAMGDYDLV